MELLLELFSAVWKPTSPVFRGKTRWQVSLLTLVACLGFSQPSKGGDDNQAPDPDSYQPLALDKASLDAPSFDTSSSTKNAPPEEDSMVITLPDGLKVDCTPTETIPGSAPNDAKLSYDECLKSYVAMQAKKPAAKNAIEMAPTKNKLVGAQPSTPHSPPPSQISQNTMLATAGGASQAGGAGSLAAATGASNTSKFFNDTAKLGSLWQNDLSQRYQNYSEQANQAQTLGASHYESYLHQSFSPPSELADLYEETNVTTKGDVLNLAPQYLPNLKQGIEDDKQLGASWEQAATQANLAAAQMYNMANALQGKASQMSSLATNGVSTLTAGANDPGPAPSSGAVGGMAGGASSAATGAAPAPTAATGTGGGAIPAQGLTGKSDGAKKSGLLRDRLRAAMKDGELNHFSGKLAGAAARRDEEDSSTDPIGTIVNIAIGAVGEGANEKAANLGEARGFSMNGSETEAAIRALTKNGDPVGNGRALASLDANLGSAEISLFLRVSQSLRQCERENCVTWRR